MQLRAIRHIRAFNKGTHGAYGYKNIPSVVDLYSSAYTLCFLQVVTTVSDQGSTIGHKAADGGNQPEILESRSRIPMGWVSDRRGRQQ